MARPAGRYFASVIAKIRDAKKKEKIAVDDGFRMQLRQQLMAKITFQAQPQKTSWMERLAPFKSYLAVVPAMALVLVAVVGISRLPIQLTSKVVIPTSNTASQQSTPTLAQSTGPVLALQQQPQQQNTTPGIKTFPGRLVLPPAFLNGDVNGGQASAPQAAVQQSGQANVFAPQPQTDQAPRDTSAPHLNTPSVSAQPEQQPAVTNFQNQQMFQYYAFQTVPAGNFSMGQGGVQPQAQTASRPAESSVSGSVPFTSSQNSSPSVSGSTPFSGLNQMTAEDQNQNSSSAGGSVPSISAEQSSTQAVSPVSATSVPAAADIVNHTASAPAAPVNTLSATGSESVANAVTKQVSANRLSSAVAVPSSFSLNDMASLPAEHLSVNMDMAGDFSSDEKTVLMKNLIPRLVDGKQVDYVYVYQQDPATIVIQLYLNGSVVAVYDYKVDAQGTWELIQAAEKK